MRRARRREHVFSVVRGIQGAMEYYVTMLRFDRVATLFSQSPEGAGLAQRRLNKARIPSIERYLLTNRDDYVLPPLMASVDGIVSFTPMSPAPEHFNIGTLAIPYDVPVFLNDGQHRREAIGRAIQQNPTLSSESIACVFFIDVGLRRRRQLFADLNRYAVRSTRSLAILYDSRDPSAEVARRVAEDVPVFRGRIDMERDYLSRRSPALFTLNAVYNASRMVSSGLTSLDFGERIDRVVEFWDELSRHMLEWQAVQNGDLSTEELRLRYVHAHGVVLLAFGQVGGALLANHGSSWRDKLVHLRDVDWRRSNLSLWEGKALYNGRIRMSERGVSKVARELKAVIGLPTESL